MMTQPIEHFRWPLYLSPSSVPMRPEGLAVGEIHFFTSFLCIKYCHKLFPDDHLQLHKWCLPHHLLGGIENNYQVLAESHLCDFIREHQTTSLLSSKIHSWPPVWSCSQFCSRAGGISPAMRKGMLSILGWYFLDWTLSGEARQVSASK